MATAKEILKRRAVDRERLEKEAPNLYNGFNELMKQYYKPSLQFLDEIAPKPLSKNGQVIS
jgi:hypothetical protein